jgi:hypothetical protein
LETPAEEDHWFKQVKQFLRNKCQDHWQGPFNLSEQEKAESTIATMLQQQSFAEMISCLKDQPTNFRLKASLGEQPDAQAFREEKKAMKAILNKMGGPLRSLDPILYEGQLRVGGRIGHSDLNFDAKHQIILPASHAAVNMLIEYTHKKEGHVGVDHILNLVRQK